MPTSFSKGDFFTVPRLIYLKPGHFYQVRFDFSLRFFEGKRSLHEMQINAKKTALLRSFTELPFCFMIGSHSTSFPCSHALPAARQFSLSRENFGCAFVYVVRSCISLVHQRVFMFKFWPALFILNPRGD